VYGEEITLKVNDESVTFNLDQVMKYSDNSVKRVNVINITSEEVVQDNTKSSNHTLVSESDFCKDPIVKTSPFGERKMLGYALEKASRKAWRFGFVVAFCSCVLSDIVHCALSRNLAFCLGKTLPISKPGCVLCQDVVAFCLEDVLRFVSRSLRAPHFGPERPREYSDLTPEEKDWYNADIWATNILLQGLPKDIYTLINHYTDAKDIWDNVKMLLEGSELTKEDRESQLLQLNSKFVNNMLPEWGRFVTAVKLNRGLRDSNYDQLCAYLKQHEIHAKENKMMLERFSQPTVDPLALLLNVSTPQQYSPSSSISSST
nr:hypothetical protein [Tanacetum cinerariifolium]